MNVPVRVAVVGLGRWGSRVLSALEHLDEFHVAALCDPDESALAPVRSRLGESVPTFARLSELIRAVDAEAVVIATAPAEQPRLARLALSAGRHVFVEKPMALSVADALAVRREAERARRVVCVGHLTRYHPMFEAALELCGADAIGTVRRIIVERVGARARPGVTPWWILAPHDLSFLLAAFPGTADVLEAHHEPWGETRAHLVLGGSVRAELRVSGVGEPRRVTVILGDHGALWLDEANSVLRHCRRPVRLTRGQLSDVLEELASQTLETTEFSAEPLQAELRAFYAAVRHGAPLPTGVEDGCRVVEVLQSVELWSGRAQPATRSSP